MEPMDIDIDLTNSNINNIFLDETLELNDSKYLFKDIQLYDYQKQTISNLLNHEKGQMKITIPVDFLHNLVSEFRNKDYTYSNNFCRDIKRYLSSTNNKYLARNNIYLVRKYFAEVNFGYNIGVLSNTVGSGKTLVILGFIMRNKFFKRNLLKNSYKKVIYNNSTFPGDICDVISEYLVEDDSFSLRIDSNNIKDNNNLFLSDNYNQNITSKIIIPTNLIIVPHNLFEQWKNEINKTFLNTKFIKDKRNLKGIKNEILNNNYDIILCNVNKVIQLLEFFPNNEYNFERIFIDEVDVINLPRFPELNTRFLWLITTTYTRILNPKNIGFINNLFRSKYFVNNNSRKFYKFLLEKLTFSFNQKYIHEKIKLIKPIKNFNIVPNNFINTLLYNLREKTYYKFLNSYDYESLYNYILKTKNRHMLRFTLRFLIFNSLGKFTDRNAQITIQNVIQNFIFDFENNASIFFILIIFRIHQINYDIITRKIIPRARHIDTLVRNIKLHLTNCHFCSRNVDNTIHQQIIYFNLHDHDITDLNSILSSVRSIQCPLNVNGFRDQLKYKMFSLKKTYLQLYEAIDSLKYIKTQFLANNYCIKCFHKHNFNESCVETTFYNFFTIVGVDFSLFDKFAEKIYMNFNNKKFIRDIKYEPIFRPMIKCGDEYDSKNQKIKNMIISLKKDIDENKRCLVFSDNNYFFKNIKFHLDKNSISNRTLKGNTNTINSIIRKYKNFDIKVLLLNMRHSGSGINLEMSDNIYIMNFLDLEMETQVIGRVNRIGKKNELNVNYYLSTHEYGFYRNIITNDKKVNIKIVEEIIEEI
jgi:hypothetical protein